MSHTLKCIFVHNFYPKKANKHKIKKSYTNNMNNKNTRMTEHVQARTHIKALTLPSRKLIQQKFTFKSSELKMGD